MNVESERDLDVTAHALAHPVRRRILELLDLGEATAGDLAVSVGDTFGISRTRASEHLQVLARAELVEVLIDGNQRWYRSVDGSASQLAAWLADRRLANLSARGAGR